MPRFVPSASRIAMELKYAGPERSKKLIGSTTPSSRATGAKCRTARLSAAVCARLRWRASCSMQKYGVSNSSGSRMICAPLEAAWRTRRSARAMLPSMSQSHAICTAATDTGRGALRKCWGSLDMLPRLSGPRPARLERAIHLLGDAHGRLERHEPRFARDDRRAAAAGALEEGIDLRLERIPGLEALLLDGHRQWTRAIGRDALADQRHDLLLQIEREVGVVLEDAHLALGLEAHTRPRGIGDAAAGEADARVGDIDVLRENRRADRVDGGDRRPDDGLH